MSLFHKRPGTPRRTGPKRTGREAAQPGDCANIGSALARGMMNLHVEKFRASVPEKYLLGNTSSTVS
jgi:hypothetical protein